MPSDSCRVRQHDIVVQLEVGESIALDACLLGELLRLCLVYDLCPDVCASQVGCDLNLSGLHVTDFV